MDEKNKNAQDFNLTTPNIRAPNNPNRPSAPGGDHDRTMPNAPPYPKDYGSAPQSSPRNAFDLTAVNFEAPGVEDDDEVVPPPRPSPPPQFQPQQQFQPPPQQAAFRQPSPAMAAPAPKRRVPLWAWLAGGGALMLSLLTIGGAVLWFMWPFSKAFTLKVLNAPAGSRVFVDDVDRSGVPQADGTIIIQGLQAGEPRDVRVTHEGYEDFSKTVTGESGHPFELRYESRLKKTEETLPSKIDYVGEMMLVHAGPFTMGDDKHLTEEKPAHPVTLPAYYIDKFEVTNEQYKKFCEATNHATPTNPFWDPQYFESNPQMPVIGVSFTDATAYAEWVGKRLPSEAEWEKASSWEPQAKRKRQWPWGDAAEASRANVNSQHPTPVGQYPNGASAYGVHDMAGNVQEWVDGFYQPYQGNLARDPKFGNTSRVTRGGSFRGKLEDVRTTRRRSEDPSYKTKPEDAIKQTASLVGFRCAVSVDALKLTAHLQQTKK